MTEHLVIEDAEDRSTRAVIEEALAWPLRCKPQCLPVKVNAVGGDCEETMLTE